LPHVVQCHFSTAQMLLDDGLTRDCRQQKRTYQIMSLTGGNKWTHGTSGVRLRQTTSTQARHIAAPRQRTDQGKSSIKNNSFSLVRRIMVSPSVCYRRLLRLQLIFVQWIKFTAITTTTTTTTTASLSRVLLSTKDCWFLITHWTEFADSLTALEIFDAHRFYILVYFFIICRFDVVL